MNRDDAYFEAMMARDNRFDGKFFVGVKTTGIYCRPICPARPKRENVEFFPNHLAAERAGYRPCLRCRPEAAPLSPAWIGKSAVVRRAIRLIQEGESAGFNESKFAARFGLTARHLRRLFKEEVGKTPKQLSFENRLNLSRKLLAETSLAITEVAFAAGFGSVRRFNDAFKTRFKRSPREIRRSCASKEPGPALALSLPYRPPFDFEGLLCFYRSHQVGELEWFPDGAMGRIVERGGKTGWVLISNRPESSSLRLECELPDTSMIQGVVARVRALFDLDSDPTLVANCLEKDRSLKALLKKHPGIRLPSGWDSFETSIAAILGQLVSVSRGRALVAELIELCGRPVSVNGKTIKLFPTPRELAEADLSLLPTTGARKSALQEFSRAVAEGLLSLEPTQPVEAFLEKAQGIRGIGPWTASYIAMKALRHTDAFPASDLILSRALKLHPRAQHESMSPWRAYGAALLWREYSHLLKKKRTSP